MENFFTTPVNQAAHFVSVNIDALESVLSLFKDGGTDLQSLRAVVFVAARNMSLATKGIIGCDEEKLKKQAEMDLQKSAREYLRLAKVFVGNIVRR